MENLFLTWLCVDFFLNFSQTAEALVTGFVDRAGQASGKDISGISGFVACHHYKKWTEKSFVKIIGFLSTVSVSL